MSSFRKQVLPWLLFAGVFVVALVVALGGLSGEPAHAEKPEMADGPMEVLAKVGDTELSAAEVEERIAADLFKLKRDRHDLLSRALDSAVRDRLMEIEAEERDLTVDELFEAEVTSKLGEVTDEEIDSFYEENKARIAQPKEAIADQIRQFVSQQNRDEAAKTFIASLESKYTVTKFLEVMRTEVASDGFPSKGPEGAPITIVEFSDFECPFCSRVLPTLAQVEEKYGDKVRLVFRQFPLHSLHPNAQKASEAALCAHEQDKFWEMHDTMFGEQKLLGVEQLKEKAARLGLDTEKFNVCLDTGATAAQVDADVQAGRAVGISGTPAMFVNGLFVNGAVPFADLAELIDKELERAEG